MEGLIFDKEILNESKDGFSKDSKQKLNCKDQICFILNSVYF